MTCIIFLVHNFAISTRFSVISGSLIQSKSFSTISRIAKFTKKPEENTKGLQTKVLKVLDLIKPKTTSKTLLCQNHLRLIQSCKQDLEEPSPIQSLRQRSNRVSISLDRDEVARDVFNEISDWDYLCFAMHKKGIHVDPSSISCTLSSCASVRALEPGIQLHCLALKTGSFVYVHVGSSLVSLYAKCGRLVDARKVFDEMPVRNVVSWTALIAGFAQNWQLEMCINIYHQMRCSRAKPNDITFIILLSACTESGALGHGRSAHCQVIHMGFDSYSHVSNALISMYSKCGNVEDSFCIFEKLEVRDLISWNSMIAAYAHHGLAVEAINLFKQMEDQKVKPDAITFLGVLSSCRHAGLIEEARACFKYMLQYGIEPELDHYSCMVDLLGRVGLLDEARNFMKNMPIQPNAIIWGSLLASCRAKENVWIGIEAAKKRLVLDPGCAATHVQLANLYASVWCWDDAARVRKLMKDRRLKTNPGYSWIEIRNEICRFRVEDNSNPRMGEILDVVDSLVDHMRDLGYVSRINVQV